VREELVVAVATAAAIVLIVVAVNSAVNSAVQDSAGWIIELRLYSPYTDPHRRPGLPRGRVIGSPHWSGFHPSFGGRSGRPEFPPCRMPGGDPPGDNA